MQIAPAGEMGPALSPAHASPAAAVVRHLTPIPATGAPGAANTAGSIAVVDIDATAQAWLEAECGIIAGLSHGVVLRRAAGEKTARPIARWPANRNQVPKALVAAGGDALQSGTALVRGDGGDGSAGDGSCIVACPLPSEGAEACAVVIELPGAMRRQQQAVVQLLQWGGVWFRLLNREPEATRPDDRIGDVAELLAGCLEQGRFRAAATTAVTELASRLSCSRVSLGLLRGDHVDVVAISHSTRVDRRSNLVRDIGIAMDEAVDQDATVAFPPLPDALPYVSFAQETLAERGEGAAVCSTPLYSGTRTIGALTLECHRNGEFDAGTLQICETLSALLGPIIELKHEKDRWIGRKVWESLCDMVRRLLGRGHVAFKLYALLLVALVAFFSVATGEFRVTAGARVEGSVKRVVAAPMAGFVATAELRAGDTVEPGQVLATLDDRELRLEQLRLQSQREQYEKEHRAASTGGDRSKAAILKAQIKQVDAQLALVGEQLTRMRLTAPIGGVIVSGDLSQNLGSPVENGQVLFEVAPLDSYRVILEVDERDIGRVDGSQQGELTLTGLPHEALPFSVSRLVPLSTPRDGRNYFEVEAELAQAAPSIRPGMEGVAKIGVDRRKLFWIWTHDLVDWLRLSMWTWLS